MNRCIPQLTRWHHFGPPDHRRFGGLFVRRFDSRRRQERFWRYIETTNLAEHVPPALLLVWRQEQGMQYDFWWGQIDLAAAGRYDLEYVAHRNETSLSHFETLPALRQAVLTFQIYGPGPDDQHEQAANYYTTLRRVAASQKEMRS